MSSIKTIEVVAAVIVDEQGRIFATQRGYGEWKDWWEFPVDSGFLCFFRKYLQICKKCSTFAPQICVQSYNKRQKLIRRYGKRREQTKRRK